MATTNPAPSTTASGSTAPQPSTMMSLNQVRAGDPLQQPQQPPTPPRRSSSFFPMRRWHASELLPHSYTTHMQKPVETNPRYAYNFSQSQRQGSYIRGFIPRQYSDDEQNDVFTAAGWYDSVFSPLSQNLNGYKRPTEGNINRESYRYGSTQRRVPVHMQDHAIPQNMHSQVFYDAQGNTGSQRLRHSRSHTLDSIHRHDGYTENIRAMAGQMYGEPPTHTDLNRNAHMPADRYAHSHNYTHNRSLTRHHHLRLSGGLWHGAFTQAIQLYFYDYSTALKYVALLWKSTCDKMKCYFYSHCVNTRTSWKLAKFINRLSVTPALKKWV